MSSHTVEFNIPCKVSMPENLCADTRFKGTSTVETSDDGYTTIRLKTEINSINEMKKLSMKPQIIVKTTFLNESKDKQEIHLMTCPL